MGINSTELANRSGILTSFLYDVIRGKSSNPSIVKLAKVAQSLGVSLTYLACGSETEENYIIIPYLTVNDTADTKHSIISENNNKPPYSFHKGWLKNNIHADIDNLHILVVDNDKMQPALHSNDIVIIDTSKNITSFSGTKIFVLYDGQNLSAIQANSDNQPAMELSKTGFSVIGCVVWLSRTI